jgi:hypothetical protein
MFLKLVNFNLSRKIIVEERKSPNHPNKGERHKVKETGRCENRTHDLSHPKRESYH